MAIAIPDSDGVSYYDTESGTPCCPSCTSAMWWHQTQDLWRCEACDLWVPMQVDCWNQGSADRTGPSYELEPLAELPEWMR